MDRKILITGILMLNIFLLSVLSPITVSAEPTLQKRVQQRISQAIVLYIDTPTAYVNGAKTLIDSANTDVCPTVKNGRTLIPVRFISESLGAMVNWDNTANRVTITLGNNVVALSIGSREIAVNGTVSEIDVPAEIINGRTNIPLRALVESLDKELIYDSGLILIEDKENAFDDNLSDDLVDELIFLCAGRGNSINNSSTQGFFAGGGEWVYYRNPRDNGHLYKMNVEGTRKIKLNDDDVYFINVIGNWIYYLNSSEIYKIRKDGTDRTSLNDYGESMTVIGNWIYYVGDYDRLYKMRTDGTGKTQLSKDAVGGHLIGDYFMAVEGNWIYYYRDGEIPPEAAGLYRIRTDGTEKTKLLDHHVGNFTISGEWLYFSYSLDGLYKMKLDGSEKTAIQTDCDPNYMNITGEWIYYREARDNCVLYKMKTDGTAKTKLNDDDTWYVSIIGDWIYYERFYNDNGIFPLYRIRFDGSQRTKIT